NARSALLHLPAGEAPAHRAVLQRDDAIGYAGIAQRLAADDAARAAGAVHHHQRVGVGRRVVHAVGELGARHVDAARDAHAPVFLEGPRVEHHDLLAAGADLVELFGADAWRLVRVLDELAEGLRRHVDAAEKLAARGAPGIAAAVEHLHRRIAQRAQPLRGSGGETLAAVEHHDRRGLARHEIGDDHLEARERRRTGVERMAAVVHALLAYVEQRKLAVPREASAQVGDA